MAAGRLIFVEAAPNETPGPGHADPGPGGHPDAHAHAIADTHADTRRPTPTPTPVPSAGTVGRRDTGAHADADGRPPRRRPRHRRRHRPHAPDAGLTAGPWTLTSITLINPPFQGEIPADQQGKYTITFLADGTFSAQADCNVVVGSYTTANPAAATGDLTITPGPSSGAGCPDGSHADLYVLALTRADTYSIATGGLTIALSDGGSLGFEAAT